MRVLLVRARPARHDGELAAALALASAAAMPPGSSPCGCRRRDQLAAITMPAARRRCEISRIPPSGGDVALACELAQPPRVGTISSPPWRSTVATRASTYLAPTALWYVRQSR